MTATDTEVVAVMEKNTLAECLGLILQISHLLDTGLKSDISVKNVEDMFLFIQRGIKDDYDDKSYP